MMNLLAILLVTFSGTLLARIGRYTHWIHIPAYHRFMFRLCIRHLQLVCWLRGDDEQVALLSDYFRKEPSCTPES